MFFASVHSIQYLSSKFLYPSISTLAETLSDVVDVENASTDYRSLVSDPYVQSRDTQFKQWPYPCPPNFPPSTTHPSTWRYAVSRSSFTTILSCAPSSFAKAISLSAWSNLFFTLSSSSVPLPRNLFSNTSNDGGDRNRNRAFRSVFLTCLTP